MKKKALLFLKIGISAVLIYLIFLKIPFSEVSQTLLKVHWGFLLLALLFFIISKVLAAYRLQYFWRSIGVHLSHSYNLKLYLLGMFYNLFLPGGIGGDAYKGYLVKKTFETPTKKIFGALLVDRLSGLLLLSVFSALLAAIGIHEILSPFRCLFVLAIPLGILVYYLGVKKMYPYTLAVFWKAFALSVGVQVSQLVAAFFILWALGQNQEIGMYLLVFLISSIVAVIPLTIGGIGSRELTFLYGAQWLALDYKTAIAMSLLFFFITASVSITGMVYHFRSLPEPGKNTK
tara:strand:- start:109 stop:975 length:867 start_codon:yes stop_codon:yes gene_type:complete